MGTPRKFKPQGSQNPSAHMNTVGITMRKLLHLSILFGLVAACIAADKPETDKLIIMGITYGGVSQHIYELEVSDLPRIPRWNPDADEPLPLPIERITSAAREWSKSKYPQVHTMKIIDFGIHKMVDRRCSDCWYYEVEFLQADHLDDTLVWRVVVLLDGRVIEPRIVREPSRANPQPTETR